MVCCGVGFSFVGLIIDELAYEVVLCSKSAYILIYVVPIVVAAFALNFTSVLEAFLLWWSCGVGWWCGCDVRFVDAKVLCWGCCGLFICFDGIDECKWCVFGWELVGRFVLLETGDEVGCYEAVTVVLVCLLNDFSCYFVLGVVLVMYRLFVKVGLKIGEVGVSCCCVLPCWSPCWSYDT